MFVRENVLMCVAVWIKRVLAAVFVIGAFTSWAHAQMVISNLSDAQTGDADVDSVSWNAQEFITGSQSFQLTSIIVPLSILKPNQAYTASAELVTDNCVFRPR